MEVTLAICPPCHGSGRHRNSMTSTLICGTCSGAGELTDEALDAYWEWYAEAETRLTKAARQVEGWWCQKGIGEEPPRPDIGPVPPAVAAMFGGFAYPGYGGPAVEPVQ